MRWTARAQDRFRRLTAFTAGFLLVCIVATANAGVRVNATSARHAGVTATGVRTTTTFEATLTGTANGVRNYAVPVPVSSSTLGGLARAAMKRVGPAAALYQTAKSIIDGAGWAIDELQEQVVDGPSVPAEQVAPGTRMLCSKYGFGCSTSPTAFYALVNADLVRDGQSGLSVVSHTSDGTFAIFRLNNSGSYVYSWNTVSTWTPNYGTGHTPTPITDQQLGDLLKTSPEVINAILIDPETGAPIHTPELVQAMNDLRRSIEAANAIDPGPDATPKDPMETQPMESAWPTFCSWASTVCDFINWVKTDDPDTSRPEVPWEEEDPASITQSWSSGLGGGSCPAPVTFSVSLAGTTASPEFSFEPVCQFGTVMRPVIIALAAIIAGFIIAGVRGTKDA